jgi:DNA uptake protein ComE-like DNA-binding protein
MTARRRPRAVVLFAVLLVVTLAALAGTTAMVLADAGVSSARTALKRAQTRALAWSGVQAVMQELSEQREDLLLGGTPTLTREWTLFTGDTGERGLLRLKAFRNGACVQSECGRIDVNTADAAMLAALEGMSQELADRVVQARSGRSFTSPEDLLRVEGVTPELLYGSAQSEDGADTSRRAPDRDTDEHPASGLLEAVTVFAFDPNIQGGVGDGGSDHRGKLRINLNAEWSAALGKAIEDRFGADAAKAIEQFMKSGETYKKDADIVKKMRGLNIPPEAWPPVLDAFTTTDEPYRIGRVDLMTANREVLACVPGIDPSAAAAIVEARSRLDEESRLTPAWTVTQGVLTPEQFEKAVDYLTTRSMVWRVRVEAGLTPSESRRGEEPRLSDRMVLEAVIDLSSERPRVAYLRDVTSLPSALAMYERLPPVDASSEDAETGSSAGPEDPKAPGSSNALNGKPDGRTRPTSQPSSPAQGRNGPAPSGGAAGEPPAKTPGRAAGTGADRRVGRWTIGPKGQGGEP